MATREVKLDEKAAKRIGNAVRYVERQTGGVPKHAWKDRQTFFALGVAVDDIPYRKRGTVTIWRVTPPTEDAPNDGGTSGTTAVVYEATDDTVEAYAWGISSGKQIQAGDEVFLIFMGRWFCNQCEHCPEDIPP